MATISIGYSTGNASSSIIGLTADGAPAFGLNALGGKMGRSSSYMGVIYGTSINGQYGDAKNRIWKDALPSDYFDGGYSYRCLYLKVDSGIIINPTIYIDSGQYVEYEIKLANQINIECSHVIQNEHTEPEDPNSTGPWIPAISFQSAISIVDHNKMMSAGDFIYFWVKRKLISNNGLTSKNLEKFSVCVSAE